MKKKKLKKWLREILYTNYGGWPGMIENEKIEKWYWKHNEKILSENNPTGEYVSFK